MRAHVRQCGSNSFKCKSINSNHEICNELFNPSYEFHSHVQCKTYSCTECLNNHCDPTWAAIDRSYIDYHAHITSCEAVNKQCNLIKCVLTKARAKFDLHFYTTIAHTGPIHMIQMEVNTHYENIIAAQTRIASKSAFQDLIAQFKEKIEHIHKMINIPYFIPSQTKKTTIPLISLNNTTNDLSSMPQNIQSIVVDAVNSLGKSIPKQSLRSLCLNCFNFIR